MSAIELLVAHAVEQGQDSEEANAAASKMLTTVGKDELDKGVWSSIFDAIDTEGSKALSRKAWSLSQESTVFFDVVDKKHRNTMTRGEWNSHFAKTQGKVAKMWNEDGLAIEDTNMAGVGSEEDKAARKGAASKEPAWQGVGQEPGIWIWRIESFEVKEWPKEKWGTFHEGDSYILLHAEKAIGDDGEELESLERSIHFWLGKKTSIDEKGTAAYKTVELDDFFDGQPTQTREVQGIESEQFLEYFPKGLKYLPGGVESGFNVVQSDVFVTKLYQFRRNAKKKIIMEEEAVNRASLNHRDAFILDTGDKLYIWTGDECSPFVKNAAGTQAENWESERNGNAEAVREVDDAFWEALGGEGEITSADAVGKEVEADFGEGVLYSVNVDESRQLAVEEVGRGDLTRDMLDTTAIMMLDNRVEIFMWLGKQASEIEKRSAMPTAVNYLKTNGRDPDQTAIHIIKEGAGKKNKIWAKTFS